MFHCRDFDAEVFSLLEESRPFSSLNPKMLVMLCLALQPCPGLIME